MITRRGLLAGILAAGVAPALVKNPMKIWVPRQEIITRIGPIGAIKIGDVITVADMHARDMEKAVFFAFNYGSFYAHKLMPNRDSKLWVVTSIPGNNK